MPPTLWLPGAEHRAFREGVREAKRLAAGHHTLTYQGEITWPRAAANRVELRVRALVEGWQRHNARLCAAYHRRTLAYAAAVQQRQRTEAALAQAEAALAGADRPAVPFLPPVDHRLSHGWHLILLVLITVLEWPLVYMMLQLLSVGQLLTAMAAASLAIATVAVCDHLGALLRRPRIPAGFWPLAGVLTAYLLAGSYLRAVYVRVAGDATDLTVTATFLTFLSIQVLLAVCAIYLAQRTVTPEEAGLERARRALAAARRAEERAARALARTEQTGRLRAEALQAHVQAEAAAGRVCIDAYWRGLAAGWPGSVPFPPRAFYLPEMPAVPLLWPPPLPAPMAEAVAPSSRSETATPAWLRRPAAAPAPGDD